MHRQSIIPTYFKIITFLLYTAAALPETKVFKSELKTFLFNKVWPVVFFTMWTPLVPMITLKLHQFIRQEKWDDLLDLVHMFILGLNALYYSWAVQKTAKNFKATMDIVNNHFKTAHTLNFKREIWMHVVIFIVLAAFFMCVVSNLYYGDMLIPTWVPYLDNDKPLPLGVYTFIWLYEGAAGVYLVIAYGIVAPFTVAMTSVICTEMFYLIRQLEKFRYYGSLNETKVCKFYNNQSYLSAVLGFENEDDFDEIIKPECFHESDTKWFIRAFVLHHRQLMRTINEVGQIHKYIFFTQAFFTITHSCFLAFSMYYTDRLFKVIVKYCPLLVVSYYLLYMYCWNGQRLTDTCEELRIALYRCRWIGAPKSFKKSLIIITEYCKQPVYLTGGGIFSASLHTFLQGLQQSFSYILILKEMTPERNNG